MGPSDAGMLAEASNSSIASFELHANADCFYLCFIIFRHCRISATTYPTASFCSAIYKEAFTRTGLWSQTPPSALGQTRTALPIWERRVSTISLHITNATNTVGTAGKSRGKQGRFSKRGNQRQCGTRGPAGSCRILLHFKISPHFFTLSVSISFLGRTAPVGSWLSL